MWTRRAKVGLVWWYINFAGLRFLVETEKNLVNHTDSGFHVQQLISMKFYTECYTMQAFMMQ